MSQQKNHEPYTLAAGDTISFRKTLPNYLASDGWTLKYELRGQQVPIEFASTADGNDHIVLVDAATTANWIPGDYQFAGYAELDGQRSQFFLASITVTPNLETATGDTPLTTHAQRMLASLETLLEKMAQDDILDTSVEGTEVRRQKREEIYQLRAKYKREREAEIAAENVKNGRPSGRLIRPVVNVMFPGSCGIPNLGGSLTR